MSFHDIKRFAVRVERDPALRRSVAVASSPSSLVGLAASLGLSITTGDLRRASRDLAAPYWPWSARGRQHRYLFFSATQPASLAGSAAPTTGLPVTTALARSAA